MRNVVKSITSFCSLSIMLASPVSAAAYTQQQCQDDKLGAAKAAIEKTLAETALQSIKANVNTVSSGLHNGIVQNYATLLPWKGAVETVAYTTPESALLQASVQRAAIAGSTQAPNAHYSHITAYQNHKADSFFAEANRQQVFFQSAAVTDETLDSARGAFAAEQLGVAIQETIAINNTTVGGITGDNLITDNAFTGTSGLVSLIQNSGNNVSIQQAVVINLSLE